MKNSQVGIMCVVVAVVAFFIGSAHGKSAALSPAALQNLSQADRQTVTQALFSGGGGMMRGGARGMRGAGGMGGGVSGEVIAKDDKSITIKDRTGGSNIIFINSATTYKKTAEGALADVAIGKQISVTGDAGTDGSIVAQQIQVRPDMVATST